MWAPTIVVTDPLPKNRTNVPFARWNHEVQAFAADGVLSKNSIEREPICRGPLGIVGLSHMRDATRTALIGSHSMLPVSHPLQFLIVAVAGWINQQQREVIDYLQTRPSRAARCASSPIH